MTEFVKRMAGGLKFDGTVHLGHILQVVLFLGGILAMWSAMDKRVSLLEHQVVDAIQDRSEMQQEIRRMAHSINAMAVSQERLNTILARAWDAQTD